MSGKQDRGRAAHLGTGRGGAARKHAAKEQRCTRCGTSNPHGASQCFGCGRLFDSPQEAPRHPIARLAGPLGRALAFLAVLGAFGAVFWLLSGENFHNLAERVLPAAPPPETVAPPAPAPRAAAPVTVVELTSEVGTVRIPVGGNHIVDLGHRGHRVRVRARASNGGVTLQIPGLPPAKVTDGGTVTLGCTHKNLDRRNEAGVISVHQVPCEESLTVRVRLTQEPPPP